MMLLLLLLFVVCAKSAAGGTSTNSDQFINKEKSIYVGGWGNWRYEYEPMLLPVPAEASVENAHGIYIDGTNRTITITYQDGKDSSKCLIRWKNDANNGYIKAGEFIGPGKSLCNGVPHGLRASIEEAGENNNGSGDSNKKTTYLYHANNQQALHKTTVDGTIIWSIMGPPQNTTEKYSPTWFATSPENPFIYMADGYGSSKIYVFTQTGKYTNYSFGGVGSDHGQFKTCHAITWDDRFNQMVVSDRENHRLEYFKVDPWDPSIFSYTNTTSLVPYLQRPCNVRFWNKDSGVAIVPALEGTVGILDKNNKLLSVINITAALGDRGFLHPHDAHFMPGPSGDFILVTWNPGRIGYFRRLNNNNEHMAQEK